MALSILPALSWIVFRPFCTNSEIQMGRNLRFIYILFKRISLFIYLLQVLIFRSKIMLIKSLGIWQLFVIS